MCDNTYLITDLKKLLMVYEGKRYKEFVISLQRNLWGQKITGSSLHDDRKPRILVTSKIILQD